MGSLENRLDSLDEQMIQGPTPFQSCHHQTLRIATLTMWTASIAKPREWRQGSAHGKSGFGRAPVAESRDPFPSRPLAMTRRLISSGSTFERSIGYSRAVVD